MDNLKFLRVESLFCQKKIMETSLQSKMLKKSWKSWAKVSTENKKRRDHEYLGGILEKRK